MGSLRAEEEARKGCRSHPIRRSSAGGSGGQGGDALSYFHSVHAIFTTVALAQAGVGRRPTIKNVEFAVVKIDAEV